jgi:exopolysaccharide biosynthesis polyprenyl glycosylphosphotransferase
VSRDEPLVDVDIDRTGGPASPPLRRILAAFDAAALAIGWAAAEAVYAFNAGQAASQLVNVAVFTLVGVAAGMFLLSAAGLYRRRICQVRSVEVTRIIRVAFTMSVLAGFRATGLGAGTALAAAAAAGATLLLLLTVERGFLREWIAGRRAGGDYRAPVIVVGVGNDVFRTASFLNDHPVLGFEVLGVVAPEAQRPSDDGALPWLGDVASIREAAFRHGAAGVVIDGGSLTGNQLNDAVISLSATNLHIHVTSGLRGIDRRRITLSPVADETVLHIKPTRLSRPQEVAKRSLDVLLAGSLLVATAPLLLLVAAAIWLDDRGPVIFRQARVGQDGEHFTVYKLRTMVVDAEAQLASLQADNARTGPLFKMSRDPRLTGIGGILRSTSIDELPQLLNVLEGTMSLVGPRPALPSEVESFDDELLGRTRVKPGVTGLWQVEARDQASFDLYRRYDLLYVQNWSLVLDLAIIGRTVTGTVTRTVRAILPFRRSPAAGMFE